VDDWILEKLATFDAEAAELEDEGDKEPDGCRVLSFDRVSPRRAYRGRSLMVD
jgi:hypothetical protein